MKKTVNYSPFQYENDERRDIQLKNNNKICPPRLEQQHVRRLEEDQQTTHKAALLDLRKSLNSEKSSENCKLTLEMFPQCQIRRKSSKKPISFNKLKIRFIGIEHLLLTLIRRNEKRYPLASYVLK